MLPNALPLPGVVHLRCLTLGSIAAELDALERDLTDEERGRATRFQRAEDRLRFIGGRSLMRRWLGAITACAPGAVPLEEGPHGKPYLRGGAIDVNVSHSGERVLAAVARSAVGVDIERIRPVHDINAMIQRCFTEEERSAFAEQGPNERSPAEQLTLFYRLWTRKEAFVKAQGAGLSTPLQSFAVTTGCGVVQLTRVDGEHGPAARWTLVDVSVEAEYPAALAVEGSCETVLWIR